MLLLITHLGYTALPLARAPVRLPLPKLWLMMQHKAALVILWHQLIVLQALIVFAKPNPASVCPTDCAEN